MAAINPSQEFHHYDSRESSLRDDVVITQRLRSHNTRMREISLRVEEAILEVEEIDFVRGASQSGIDPTEVVAVNHIVGQIALLDEDHRPLTALSFVAS